MQNHLSCPVPAIGVEFVSTPNPHYIPGYTGHCPQLKLQVGHSYGVQSHKLFLDSTVPHSKKLVLSDKEVGDYQLHKVSQCDVDAVNARLGFHTPVKCHDNIVSEIRQLPSESSEIGTCNEQTEDEKNKLSIMTDSKILCQYLERPRRDIEIPKKLDVGATKIYHEHIGQVPNYGGHIPGEIFRFGKCYGNTTIDGKRYLRGDIT